MAERYQLKKDQIREKYNKKKYDDKTRRQGPTTYDVIEYFKRQNKEKLNLDLLEVCKSCKKEFGDTSILRHLKDKFCRKDYDKDELE